MTDKIKVFSFPPIPKDFDAVYEEYQAYVSHNETLQNVLKIYGYEKFLDAMGKDEQVLELIRKMNEIGQRHLIEDLKKASELSLQQSQNR